MTRPSQDLDITQFLVTIAASDRRGKYVAPLPDVAERIAQEIQSQTGAKHTPLTLTNGKKPERVFISADPSKFICESGATLDIFVQLLKKEHAKEFNIAFHNTQTGENWFGDKVLFSVRYN